MPYLLNFLYACLLLALAPYLAWVSWRTGKYRDGWSSKLWGMVPGRQGDQPCIWFHAVSVGEVNLLGVLISEVKQRLPDCQIFISTTTKTGMEVALRQYNEYTVFYCPLDFSWATNRAMRRIHPDLLVLAELELWPNLVRSANTHGARVAVINGRLSENSFRGYRRIRFLVKRLLNRLDLIAVQDETYLQRFLALGAPSDRIVTTGSIKFDGAHTDRENPRTRQLAQLAGFTDNDVVLLAGSTQAGEEEVVLQAFLKCSKSNPQLRLVLVPRHPERFDEVATMLENRRVCYQRRTQLQLSPPDPASRILLVDAVGELGAWWGTASIGFVGGSLGSRGGQNMIEPAGYGAAVCFGPNTRNFRDVVTMLLARDAAVVVADEVELARFVERCLKDEAYATDMGQRAQQLVRDQQGAACQTIDLLQDLLNARTIAFGDSRNSLPAPPPQSAEKAS